MAVVNGEAGAGLYYPDSEDDELRSLGFPIAEPPPPPVMISRPCGCTSMDIGDGGAPVQVSWCDGHDPGYEP